MSQVLFWASGSISEQTHRAQGGAVPLASRVARGDGSGEGRHANSEDGLDRGLTWDHPEGAQKGSIPEGGRSRPEGRVRPRLTLRRHCFVCF